MSEIVAIELNDEEIEWLKRYVEENGRSPFGTHGDEILLSAYEALPETAVQ